MKINDILTEMATGKMYDANNLPQELQVGDVFASMHEVFGETSHGDAFKVSGKKYDEELGTYKYTAFSVERLVPSHDPEEAPDYQDFVFTIENGKPKPVSGSYASVARDYF